MEQQHSLPHNHGALLRFRSNIVGEVIRIPFKKVTVYKGVLCEDGLSIVNDPTIRDFNAYSLKATGQALARSIVSLDKSTRYIAPFNLISLLSHKIDIRYGMAALPDFISKQSEPPVISTIPMPSLMHILDYPEPPQYFNTRTIWSINCILDDVDVYQTLYVPYDNEEPYRVSITGNRMTLEFAKQPEDMDYIDKYIAIIFGCDLQASNASVKEQEYGKIIPISEHERQKFILWATDNYNIYSLGRYATWRQILLDDVMKDIGIIQKFIDQRSDYERAMHYHVGEL
jgi:hypothetical protein